MGSRDAVVVAVGMVTAVGLNAPQSAAAVRAGIANASATPWVDDRLEPVLVAQVPDGGLPALAEGLERSGPISPLEGRLLRLGAQGLGECCAMLRPGLPPPALLLALPESESPKPLDRQMFLRRLAYQTGGIFDERCSECRFGGRAGGLLAVGEAVRRVRNEDRLILAGGVDSFRDFWVLDQIDAQRRLKVSGNMDGFIPGEGAAFLALANRRMAGALGLEALATLSTVAEDFESGHLFSDEPYRGEGLARALRSLVSTEEVRMPVSDIYASMNGESYWAKEWGVAFLRNRKAFAPEHDVHHPAQSTGDTGAACGPILLGLALAGMRKGYRRSPCLAYCSSDLGARAVAGIDLP
jgi:3-oxoacyl-[acyl-carrier-protein] synthase I